MKKITLLPLLPLVMILQACQPEPPEHLLTFHVAPPRAPYSQQKQEEIVMPLSKTRCAADGAHIFTIARVDSVDLAQVQIGDTNDYVMGFLFTFDQVGTSRIYQATANNIGGMILLKDNGNPVALRHIDGVVSSGQLFMVSEFSEETNLHLVVEKWKESIERAKELNSITRVGL